MNKRICIIILLLTCRICDAQNLVPNGGFENYSQLPNGAGEYSYCNGWNNCSGFGTPDYFHMNGSGSADLPFCYISFLLPHSGLAVMGIALNSFNPNWPNFREYLSRSLLNPLIVGQNYQLTFYINNGSVPFFYGGYACDHFSVAFSTVQLIQSTSTTALVMNFNPQFIYNGFLYNNNWQLVSFNFTADSAYQFITFGSFVNDTIQQVQLHDSASQVPAVYYYIDDINLQGSTGINDNTLENSSLIFPDPFSDVLNISMKKNDIYDIILYDIASRKILQKKFANSVSLNTEQLAKGIYIYELRDRNGLCKKGKVVKD